jgi:hypothetical protein
LFHINIETGHFGVSIEPKQTRKKRNKPKKGKKLINKSDTFATKSQQIINEKFN